MPRDLEQISSHIEQEMSGQNQEPAADTTDQVHVQADSSSDMSEREVEARELGWLDLDEWTAAGKDPKDWSGYEVFHRFRNMADADKSLRSELAETKEGINQMLTQFNQMNERQRNAHKVQLQRAMDQAKKDLDVDAFEKASNHLNAINAQETASNTTHTSSGEPPEIVAFRKVNPILDHGSDDFDPVFNKLMEANANQRFNSMSGNGQFQPSPQMVEQILKDAYSETEREIGPKNKGSGGEYQPRKPRKAPNTAPPARGKGGGSDPTSGLDAAGVETYNFLKKKVSKSAADNFAKNMRGGE